MNLRPHKKSKHGPAQTWETIQLLLLRAQRHRESLLEDIKRKNPKLSHNALFAAVAMALEEEQATILIHLALLTDYLIANDDYSAKWINKLDREKNRTWRLINL